MNEEVSLTETASILREAPSIIEESLMREAASKDTFNEEALMMRLQRLFLSKFQLVAKLLSLNVIDSIR